MTQHGSRSTDASASIPDWDALARFVAGESPADEVARVEAWLAAHPRDRELLARLESATRLSEPADVNVGAALANVHRRMEGETTVRRIDTARRFRPSYALPVGLVLAAAAALVLFVWRK